jgi:hypothetical protein
MTDAAKEFLIESSVDECISRLKALPQTYFSLKLNIALRQIDSDNCQFHMRAVGVAKNSMNRTLFGRLQRATATSTQVSIENRVPNRLGYLTRHRWIGSPVVIRMAFISNNPFLLLGVPVLGVCSLITVVFEQQDRDELTRIIDRAFDRI